VHLHFLVLLLCALYGSVFTLGKITLTYAPPLFITGGRMLLAALLLLLYQLCFHRKHFSIRKEHLWPVILVGLTNVYLTNALEFWGLQYMESGKACFIYSFSPIATALLSYVWFSEKITLQKWLGLFLGLLGFIPILIAHSGTEDSSGYIGFLSYAELALLGAAIATSIGWMTMRVVVKNKGCSSIMANAYSMLFGGVIALTHSFYVENWSPLPVTDIKNFLPPFLLLMLVSNIISYNLNTYLLRHYTATYLSFAGLSQPFFAAIFGFLFLNEVMSYYFWISLACVSVGLYVYYQQELKQGLSPHQSLKTPISHKGSVERGSQ
jgi:drug/metabolite transporter (DMT)-like permease